MGVRVELDRLIQNRQRSLGPAEQEVGSPSVDVIVQTSVKTRSYDEIDCGNLRGLERAFDRFAQRREVRITLHRIWSQTATNDLEKRRVDMSDAVNHGPLEDGALILGSVAADAHPVGRRQRSRRQLPQGYAEAEHIASLRSLAALEQLGCNVSGSAACEAPVDGFQPLKMRQRLWCAFGEGVPTHRQ